LARKKQLEAARDFGGESHHPPGISAVKFFVFITSAVVVGAKFFL